MPSIKKRGELKVSAAAKDVLRHGVTGDYRCTCCGELYHEQPANFYRTRNPLYRANNGYLTVCKRCMNDLYNKYVMRFDSEDAAIERVCDMFNLPFRDTIVQGSFRRVGEETRLDCYMRRVMMPAYMNDTYDDVILARREEAAKIKDPEQITEEHDTYDLQKLLRFWGPGFEDNELVFLQDEYNDWRTRYECQSKAQEEIFKNISRLQLMANRAQEKGNTKAYMEAVKLIQDLTGDANIKPSKVNDNTLADQNTFGTLIKKWEEHDPIADPDPAWQDVDGIKHYITTWFLGHLCRIFGVKNDAADEYEREVEKYTVHPPEYTDDEEADEYVAAENDGD